MEIGWWGWNLILRKVMTSHICIQLQCYAPAPALPLVAPFVSSFRHSGRSDLASWLSMLWGRCHMRISPGQSVRSLSQSSLFCNRMSQQEKNTEIFRLLNCLEPYKSEFQSLQRDIEFAFQKLGKYKSVHVHTSIKLIFHQKKKRKTRKIFWCSKKPFQGVLIHP